MTLALLILLRFSPSMAAEPAAVPEVLRPLGLATAPVSGAPAPRLEAGCDLIVRDVEAAKQAVSELAARFGGAFAGQAAGEATMRRRLSMAFEFPAAPLAEQVRRADRFAEGLGRLGRSSLLSLIVVPKDGGRRDAAWARLRALRAERAKAGRALAEAPLLSDLIDFEVARLEREGAEPGGPAPLRFEVYLKRDGERP